MTPVRRCGVTAAELVVLDDAQAVARHGAAHPWKRIHWFWCDERFVPPADERSNYRMVQWSV